MFFKKTDIIIIAIIAAISLASLFTYKAVFLDKPAKAEIYYYSKLVETIELNKGIERTFSIPQNENVVFKLSKDGHICFHNSDCPDKICIHSGSLHMSGQSAACLPNGIVIKIVSSGNDKDEFDIIAGN